MQKSHRAPFNVDQYSYDDPIKLFNDLRSRGYPEHVAAGITGNVMIENGGAGHFDTQRHQAGGGGGVGLFQLTNPARKKEYQQFIQKNHLDPSQTSTALDFHDHELRGDAYKGYYKNKAYDPLMRTQNVNDATLSYMRNFESPRASAAHADQRVALANELLRRVHGQQVPQEQSRVADNAHMPGGYDSLELRGETGRPSAIGDDLGGAPFARDSRADPGFFKRPEAAPPLRDISRMDFASGIHAPEQSQKLYAALDTMPPAGTAGASAPPQIHPAPEPMPQIPMREPMMAAAPNIHMNDGMAAQATAPLTLDSPGGGLQHQQPVGLASLFTTPGSAAGVGMNSAMAPSMPMQMAGGDTNFNTDMNLGTGGQFGESAMGGGGGFSGGLTGLGSLFG